VILASPLFLVVLLLAKQKYVRYSARRFDRQQHPRPAIYLVPSLIFYQNIAQKNSSRFKLETALATS